MIFPLRRPRGQFGEVAAWPVLVVLGTAGLAVAGWNLVREIRRLEIAAPPLFAALLAVALSVAVIGSGIWLRRRGLDRPVQWQVVAFALGGWAFLTVTQLVTVLIRLAEGRSIAEPVFPTLVVSLVGTLGGVEMGYLYVEQQRIADEAAETRDAVAFANSLLRHDVRNSLQVIEGRVDLLQRVDDETVREHADAIDGQTEALEALLTEVQAVVEAVTGEAADSTVDLAGIVEETVLATTQSHPDATVETDLPAELVVRGSEALRSVFDNLLSNAVEHAGEGVTVRVSAARADGTASVRVADDGPGVPPELRDGIFEAGVSENDDGGYGLYVAHTIVERFEGTLTVEDSDLDGAAFVVELPLAGSGHPNAQDGGPRTNAP